MSDDRFTEESLRLGQLLKTLAKSRGRSIRSLEQVMGVAEGIFYKVLKGKITLQVRHLLMIVEALEMKPAEFFALAYPARLVKKKPARELADEGGDLDDAGLAEFDRLLDLVSLEAEKQEASQEVEKPGKGREGKKPEKKTARQILEKEIRRVLLHIVRDEPVPDPDADLSAE
jgi:transcriptional regulator with XRE-family HTH domain